MQILKQPYDPEWVEFYKKGDVFPRYCMKIQSGETKVSPLLAVHAGLLAGSVAISFAFWPIIFINVLTLIAWMIAPQLRPIIQKKESHILKDEGAGIWGAEYAPKIDKAFLKKSPIYRDAVSEWIEAVRQTGDPGINKERWVKYLGQTRELSEKLYSVNPNFEKLKVLREMMEN